jgi:hypothetical protein
MKNKKKSTEDKGPHPYDFSLKKDTKHTKSAAKPLTVEAMAQGLVRRHSLEKAKLIVEPLTIAAFKDDKGNVVAINEASNYWKSVFQLLNKGAKNATAS